MRSTGYTRTILIVALLVAGCTEADHSRQPGTGEIAQGLADPPELESMCGGFPMAFVPEATSAKDQCRRWLGATEVELCRATVYFNAATRLQAQAAVTWPARLAYFRKAVEHLMEVLFETRLFLNPAFWQGREREESLATEWSSTGGCPTGSDNPNNADELLYFRQIKLQALELYQRIAEYYPYALVASADASRSLAGSTADRSDRVWGPDVTDPSLSFLDLKGDRGAAAAFFMGTDVAVLDSLVTRAGYPGVTKVEDGCGKLYLQSESFFDLTECNARMVTPLPPCRHAARSTSIDRARQLLRRHGVPLEGTSTRHITDGDALGGFLMARINQQRARDGLFLHTDLDALLVGLGVDRPALSSASSYLAEEQNLVLQNTHRVTDSSLPAGLQVYKDGLTGPAISLQELETRAKVNGSRVGYEDIDVVAGEVPIYRNGTGYGDDASSGIKFNYFKHSYFKTLGLLRELVGYRVDSPTYLDWADATVRSRKAEVDEPYRKILALIDDEIGSEEIRYRITLNLKVLTGTPWSGSVQNTYGVELQIPDSLPSIQVILGRRAGGDSPTGALSDGRDGLRCRLFGEVGGAPCNMSHYRAMLLSVPCQVSRPGTHCAWFRYTTEQPRQLWLPRQEYPVFVMLEGKLVDGVVFDRGHTWREWEVTIPLTTHMIRSQIDQRTSERLAKILDRSAEQCTEARYNALGLPNSLIPPLENELITSGGGGTGLEASYQHYLTKARESAAYASTKIAEALEVEGKDLRYQSAVEEALAGAQNQIEQICGEGRLGCRVAKVTRFLSELWFVPEMQNNVDSNYFQCDGFDQNPYLPNYLAMDEPPPIVSPEGFNEVGRWLRCHNQKWFTNFAATYRIVDLPEIIRRDPSAMGAAIYAYDGDYLAALLEINNGLIDFTKTMDNLFFLQDTMGMTMGAMSSQVAAIKKKIEGEKWKQISGVLVGAAKAIAAIANEDFAGFMSAGYEMQSTVTTAQIEEDVKKLELDAALKENIVKTVEMIHNVKQLYDSMRQALIRVQTGIQALKKLELLQTQAANGAERLQGAALREMLGTSCAGGEDQCLKAYRTLFNVKHLQALDALRRAQKMSFIAKRALEFKLGVDFTREQRPGILVDAPSRWQDELFLTFSDDALHNADANITTSYVQKLEDYLFGYPFDHPFADDEDLAVISLRSDLLSVDNQDRCLVEVPNTNLVRYSEQLEAWEGYLLPSGEPISRVEIDVAQAPLPPYEQTADLLVSEDRFIVYSSESSYDGDRKAEGDPWQNALSGAVWVKVDAWNRLNVGVHAVYYRKGTREGLRGEAIYSGYQELQPSDGWVQVTAQGSITPPQEDEDVTILMGISGEVGSGLYFWGAQINAGPELLPYERTPQHEVGEGCVLYQWQDPYSGTLRSEYHPSPETLASALRGRFRVKCKGSDAAVVAEDLSICGDHEDLEYFETTFSISMEEVQSGRYLRQGQLAMGNYNYRIKQLALNLVGSNVKDCTLDPGAGTACYQNLFVPYDLTQGGHVGILDYEGKTNQFNMSTGVIRYAKALAAERLLTNPPSSTDASIIAPYEKWAFRGRPLQGNYTLRIYNVPGLRWENVEDVQIYLRYRYWSAFSNP